MDALLHSRKFWLMVVDVVVSLATYFLTKYANPEAVKDVLLVIATLQPVVISVIVAITVQNVEGIRADSVKAYNDGFTSGAAGFDPEVE